MKLNNIIYRILNLCFVIFGVVAVAIILIFTIYMCMEINDRYLSGTSQNTNASEEKKFEHEQSQMKQLRKSSKE